MKKIVKISDPVKIIRVRRPSSVSADKRRKFNVKEEEELDIELEEAEPEQQTSSLSSMATQNLASEWTREKTIQLINEYRKNRGLWDMTHEDYRKKDVKRELLHKVALNIDNGKIPALEIEKKFHTLRTQYHREIHRMKRSEPYNSKWFGFKHLEFLSSPKACRQSKNFQYIKVDTPKVQPKAQEIYITPKYVDAGGE